MKGGDFRFFNDWGEVVWEVLSPRLSGIFFLKIF